MSQLESQTNLSLNYYIHNGTTQQQAEAQQEYDDLNAPTGTGYSTIQNKLTTALDYFQAGTGSSATPASVDAGLGASSTPTMPGFPGSAIALGSAKPSFTAGVRLPVLGKNWTMPALKTGNFFEDVEETLPGTFNFGDIASGTFSISVQLGFLEGFDNTLTTSSASVPLSVSFTSGIPLLKGLHFQITYTPSYQVNDGNMATGNFNQAVVFSLVSSN